VDELIQHLDTDEALAYFYCDANRQASVEVLRSFLRQLVSSRKGESIQRSLFDVYMEKKSNGFASRSLDENATRKEFLKLVDSFPQSFIVLDALDECEKDVQAVLVKALRHIINETTRPVKVLISSRPDPYIKNLLGSVVEVEVSEIGNSKDIAKFVTESVHECPEDLEDNEYWSKKMPDTLKEEICKVLIKGSGGM
jgi:ankyrin repeat domain-containing protein 50